MAGAWGDAWGDSWGDSWGFDGSVFVPPAEIAFADVWDGVVTSTAIEFIDITTTALELI